MTHTGSENPQPNSDSHTYPQFIIDEKTGRIEVNFIDESSGRVVRHIPAAELGEIVRSYNAAQIIRIRK